MARLGTAFGAISLLLGCAGIFGTMGYSVSRRSREIGLRMAIGASPAAARRMILAEALRPCLAGLAAGLPVAVAAGYAVRSMLFAVRPANFAALAGASISILLAATLAAWVPALWASRVDPVAALRSE